MQPILFALALALAPVALFAVAPVAHAATGRSPDRVFVAKVGQGGMFEVAAGRLAVTKGSTQDIRDFGAMEVHDHMLVGARLKHVAASEGIEAPTRPDAEFAGKIRTLSGLSGPAFDDAYMAGMATLHDADGAAFLAESTAGGTAAIRAFGTETHAIVQRHVGAIHGTTPPR